MSRKQTLCLFMQKRSIVLLFTMAIVLFSSKVNTLFGQDASGNVPISGTVLEASSQTPLPGVSVAIKGKTVGTITDIDGKYSLEANANDVIVFSFIGYVNEEVIVGNQSTIDISLAEDVMGLDEVVVVGYGVQKKSDLTGAVASVSSEKLTSVPIPNVEHALQGMAAGVNITPKSGKPGEDADIQIRGISSLNGTGPLVIIDGMPGRLSDLNPSDVASIEVLKDASSAAIYGVSGGNGVILVTTKKGQSGQMKVSANFNTGIASAINTLELMDAQQYAELLEEINRKRIFEDAASLPTYDWQEMVFQPTVTSDYDVSLSGGNDVSTFLFSTSYSEQNGIVKNTDHERFTMRLNSEHKINKRLTFDEKITYVNTKQEGLPQWVWHNYYNNPILNVMQADPTQPDYDENGVWSDSPNGLVNPVVNLDMTDRLIRNNNFSGNFGLKLNIIKGLDFQSRIAGGIDYEDAKEYRAVYKASPTDFRNQDELVQSMQKTLSYKFQNYLTYNVNIAESHDLTVMAGMEAGEWWRHNIYGTRWDMPSTDENLLYLDKSLNDSADVQNVGGTGDRTAGVSYFGRLNYSLKDRYLITANIRRDGAYNNPPKNRWGVFPSFSVGWKFSKEEFMQNVPYISTGKLRFGYGQVGANAPNGFPALSTIVTPDHFRYAPNGTASTGGAAPNQIANPELQWETVNMSNLGLDLTFLENRVSLSVDLFSKVNDGMILEKEVPYIAGTYDAEMPEVNFGSISNKGIEITAGVRKSTGDLKISFDANATFLKNEVESLAEDSIQAGAVHTLSETNMTLVGQPVAQFYGYVIDGMFSEDDAFEMIDGERVITDQPYYINDEGEKVYAQDEALPGDARFKDLNDDGKIDFKDRELLGSPIPKFTYGFTLNLEYKGLDFSAFFNGSAGNKLLNGSKQYGYNPTGATNRMADFADRYRDEVVKDGVVVVTENHDSDIYRVNADTYTKMSNFFVESGSFFRLRNIVLGYTIPKNITGKIGVEKLRIYAGAKNLFTITKYTGLNPEIGGNDIRESGVDIGLYPATRTFYFGANLTF